MTDEEFAIVMPFVNVQSRGGIYDDASYTAGWEMGLIDQYLGIMVQLPGVDEEKYRWVIHEGNIEQFRLVCLKHNCQARVSLPENGWVEVRATPMSMEPDLDELTKGEP